MKEKIYARIELAINNLNNFNSIEDLPKIIDDLKYILNDYEKEVNQLTPAEQFEHRLKLRRLVTDIYAKLVTLIFKILYSTDIVIEKSTEYSLALAGGGFSPKTKKISYSDLGLMLTDNTYIGVLHTFIHESRHKMQDDYFISSNLSKFEPEMLSILKESLFVKGRDNKKRELYRNNYEYLISENDAEIFTKNALQTFLNQLIALYMQKTSKRVEDIPELIETVNELNNFIKNEIDRSDFNINKLLEGNMYNEEDREFYFEVEGTKVDRLVAIDKYIKMNPQLQEEYPILRLLFNGSKPKTYEEIIRDKEMYKQGKSPEEQEHIDKIYDEIIRTDPILTLTKYIVNNEITKADEFINIHPSVLIEYPYDIQQLKNQYGYTPKENKKDYYG